MKHQILGVRWSSMVTKARTFGFPLLSENPFSSRPLESGEAGKLVGRDHEFNLLRDYLRLGTARKVMLTGPLGSGRTSLVRCLKPYAGAFVSIDHLPAHSPAQALLEMCFQQLIGGEPPVDRNDLVNRLVTEMYAYRDRLPLVVIDVPASDVSVLDVALRDAHSSLERLNAIIVLVCDVMERNHLAPAVVNGFQRFQMAPFTPLDVVTLVRQRLNSVGVVDADFSIQDATSILEGCDGYPASVVAQLRDAVDTVRLNHAGEAPLPFVDTSAQPQPREEPDRLGTLMGNSPDEATPSTSTGGGTEAQQGPIASPPTTSIIDASVNWTERGGLFDDGVVQTEVDNDAGAGADEESEEGEWAGFGGMFDLDMEALNEAQTNDEPLQPTPFTTPIIDASAVSPAGTSAAKGMFKNLAQRNKDSMGYSSKIKEEALSTPQILKESGLQGDWWVNEEESLPKPKEPVPEEEHATLIHDEIGLPVLPEMEEESLSEFEEEDEPELQTEPIAVPVTPQANLDAHGLLEALLSMVTEQGQSSSAHEGLLAFFERRSSTRFGPKETYPLDKHVLSSLNTRDAYVVAVAHGRAYSPSDREILGHLGIKRSRLSQISNRLLKHGILQVRQAGRAREYMLTQTARAQLIAWGGLKGGEA